MAEITMTYAIAMAAAQDAGNRHMRQNGRSKWAVADWNYACETFARLWPQDERGGHGAENRSQGDYGSATGQSART